MKETPPSGSALTFSWDTVTGGGTPLDIDDGTNAYIYGAGTAPVEQVNISTGAVSFLASTPSGVQAVFNTSGALQEQAAYSTYGEQVIQSGTKVTPFGFQGSYTTSSGLIYLVNRYYTPKTDQFLSVDPELAETGQPYAFTGDDPLNASDPLGLKGTYCIDNYKGHAGYTTHYFQGTNTGPANGACIDGHTQAQVGAFAAAVEAYQFEEKLKKAESTPIAFAALAPEPSESEEGQTASTPFVDIWHGVTTAADKTGRVLSCIWTEEEPVPGHETLSGSMSFEAGGGVMLSASRVYAGADAAEGATSTVIESTGYGLAALGAGFLGYGSYKLAQEC